MIDQTITIKMPPFAKDRPRVTKKNTYMNPKYVAKKEKLQWLWKEQGGQFNIEGLLCLYTGFTFKMPKSWSKKQRRETNGLPCGKAPDLDNCVGAVMDAILANDSKVVGIASWKKWGYEDEIQITLLRPFMALETEVAEFSGHTFGLVGQD